VGFGMWGDMSLRCSLAVVSEADYKHVARTALRGRRALGRRRGAQVQHPARETSGIAGETLALHLKMGQGCWKSTGKEMGRIRLGERIVFFVDEFREVLLMERERMELIEAGRFQVFTEKSGGAANCGQMNFFGEGGRSGIPQALDSGTALQKCNAFICKTHFSSVTCALCLAQPKSRRIELINPLM
jgi:hypothetical protein